MQYEGVLRKMQTEMGQPIQYYMLFKDNFLNVNQVLNRVIQIDFIKYECLNCGRDLPIFRQGFCKSCFFETPSAGDWIMRPELSTAHLNKEDRDLAYEKKAQLQPHIVYLANSSNIKVVLTAHRQPILSGRMRAPDDPTQSPRRRSSRGARAKAAPKPATKAKEPPWAKASARAKAGT